MTRFGVINMNLPQNDKVQNGFAKIEECANDKIENEDNAHRFS